MKIKKKSEREFSFVIAEYEDKNKKLSESQKLMEVKKVKNYQKKKKLMEEKKSCEEKNCQKNLVVIFCFIKISLIIS